MSIHVRETGKGRRYDVKLRDRDGVMHTKTFRTKREAVDYEADQRAQLSAGTFIAPRASATTVEDLATRWLAAGTKRDSSRARDRSIVQTHMLPGLGPKRTIGTVTRADCQALVDRWVAAGLAPRTVIRVAAALRSMFQYALDAELLARNPAARLKLPQPQPVDRPTLTSDDLDRLAHALGPEQALPTRSLPTDNQARSPGTAPITLRLSPEPCWFAAAAAMTSPDGLPLLLTRPVATERPPVLRHLSPPTVRCVQLSPCPPARGPVGEVRPVGSCTPALDFPGTPGYVHAARGGRAGR